ncbi:hypothetical protein PILCRDRAFT_65741 [Piloderma croceum F 1598]|uniref:Ribosome recycling factor domain-containing protein n=1 Tax=Piloderma croceum (strain F 1598) TaxID=765440 RepID=A0A0C3C7X9_PILCF|nr:hypothetical protein PILCRDRAFT_65741 [Piloderma croceum F 1598]
MGVVAFRSTPARIYTRLHLSCSPSASTHLQFRFYASKTKAGKSTASLVPGSKQKITDDAAIQDYEKAEKNMQAAVDWYRKEVAELETRASGRVTPAVLSHVRVELPDSKELFRLEDVATVGVREGSTLLVTVFEERTIKFVESALYNVKFPNIAPQRLDNRTIKIPIPKPTVETRNNLAAAAHNLAENSRVQIRKIQSVSRKKGKYAKHSVELEEFQKLTERNIAEIDKILVKTRKAMGAR